MSQPEVGVIINRLRLQMAQEVEVLVASKMSGTEFGAALAELFVAYTRDAYLLGRKEAPPSPVVEPSLCDNCTALISDNPLPSSSLAPPAPTRDALAKVISDNWAGTIPRLRAIDRIVDALLAKFWPTALAPLASTPDKEKP